MKVYTLYTCTEKQFENTINTTHICPLRQVPFSHHTTQSIHSYLRDSLGVDLRYLHQLLGISVDLVLIGYPPTKLPLAHDVYHTCAQTIAHHVDHGTETIPKMNASDGIRSSSNTIGVFAVDSLNKQTPHPPSCACPTYSSQSTAMMVTISSCGSPTVSRTITMVTRPACGIPAAPMLAAVAVKL